MPRPANPEALAPQDALVAIMIAMSAADEAIVEAEMTAINGVIDLLPAFKGYDKDRVQQVSALVGDLFTEEDGIDALIGLVEAALPDHLRETAYALACDIAAADGYIEQTEARLLEIIRQDLRVGRLTAAAIERGARARHQKMEPRPTAS
ncbi:MAG: tellurite resistance TerB family protein [Pseudomonadota bacterium]